MTVPIINKTQEVVCIRDIPFSFKKDDGEKVSGITRKICFIEYTDGELSGMFIAKAVTGFTCNTGQAGILGFDRFGKVNTFQPMSQLVK